MHVYTLFIEPEPERSRNRAAAREPSRSRDPRERRRRCGSPGRCSPDASARASPELHGKAHEDRSTTARPGAGSSRPRASARRLASASRCSHDIGPGPPSNAPTRPIARGRLPSIATPHRSHPVAPGTRAPSLRALVRSPLPPRDRRAGSRFAHRLGPHRPPRPRDDSRLRPSREHSSRHGCRHRDASRSSRE